MEGREVVTLMLVVVLISAGHLGPVECQLSPTYYATSCPNVDQIVRDVVGAAMNSSAIVGPGVLRLFAHDCFVKGCDASILLQDTPGAPPVERDAPDEMSLQQLSFDTINQAKAVVEAQCPGIVSCADVLTIAAMDVVNMMGGPAWTVFLGRRDGFNSTAASVAGHLPASSMDVTQLMGVFGGIGLSRQDLVTLSGAHTVGFAHCKEFSSRLYNFNNVTGATDPSLNANYTATLQALCPIGNFSNTTVQALDPITPGAFDNAYYQDLLTGRGLLFSDQVMFVDNTTTNFVTTYANNQQQFFTDFVTSMIAMSRVGVLTGTQGEIRLNCSVVNGPNSVPGNSSVIPPANSTAPTPNSTTPAPAVPTPTPVVAPPPPVVTPSPPPVVTPSPPPVVTPSPPPPVVIPSPPPPVVLPSPPPVVLPPSPPPVVIPSPPPVVLSPSPPPAEVIQSPPPAEVVQSPPPVVLSPSPRPAEVIQSPPPAEVIQSPPPAEVVQSPPPVVVPPSPPPPVVIPPPVPVATPSPLPVTVSSPPPVAKAIPSPPPTDVVAPPPPGVRRRF